MSWNIEVGLKYKDKEEPCRVAYYRTNIPIKSRKTKRTMKNILVKKIFAIVFLSIAYVSLGTFMVKYGIIVQPSIWSLYGFVYACILISVIAKD